MIDLIDGYKVGVDDYNYALVYDTGKTQQIQKKDGTTEERPVLKYLGYYISLHSAIRACMQKLVHDELQSGSFTLQEAVDTIRRITDKFNDMLEKCFPEDDLR